MLEPDPIAVLGGDGVAHAASLQEGIESRNVGRETLQYRRDAHLPNPDPAAPQVRRDGTKLRSSGC